MTKNNKAGIENLYKAISMIESVDECRLFFEDLCSIVELQTFAQRLEVAQLLLKGNSYLDVNQLTGASTTTISRIGKCINYGDGGYKTVIEKLEGDKKND